MSTPISTLQQRPSGVWLPLITPFRDGELDTPSLRRLVRHYAGTAIDGLILGATTGEGLTLDEAEAGRLAEVCATELTAARRRIPLYLGLAGSDTRKVAAMIARTETWPVDGYLISAPSYTRPSQQGLYLHFAALAEATARPVMLYNIPYRTAVNISNDTMLRLAECTNIVGLKDCSADTLQSIDLLCRRGRLYVAVEVKARSRLAAPERTVTAAQRERLHRALRSLAAVLSPRPRTLRVDVVAVRLGSPTEIRWFQGTPFSP